MHGCTDARQGRTLSTQRRQPIAVVCRARQPPRTASFSSSSSSCLPQTSGGAWGLAVAAGGSADVEICNERGGGGRGGGDGEGGGGRQAACGSAGTGRLEQDGGRVYDAIDDDALLCRVLVGLFG